MTSLRATATIAMLAVALISRRTDAQQRWTLGSPSAAVARAEGRPDFVERLASLGYEVWHFDRSWVRLAYSDDRVIAWSSPDQAMHVELKAGADTSRASTLSVGSSRDDVLRIHGTPSAYEPNAPYGVTTLRYGSASIRIATADARVVGWDDPAHQLRTSAVQSVVRDDRHEVSVAERAPMPFSDGRRHPAAPPDLRASIAFRDANDDGRLDAEERAIISLTIRNHGCGTAYGLSISLANDSGAALDIGRAARIDSLPPSQQIVVSIPVAATTALRDGVIRLTASIREANGFDVSPAARVTLQARALRAPQFVLDQIAMLDQSGNGRIEPREIVDIVARIRNRGAGDARAVRVAVIPGDGISIIGAPVRDSALGTIRAGESRDVRFSAFANSRTKGFPVSLRLREERQRFDTTIALPLALDTKIASIPELIVRGREPPAEAAAPSLVSDVDTGIPHPSHVTNTVAVVLGVERYERGSTVMNARHDAAVVREYAASLFGAGNDPMRLVLRSDDEVSGTELHRLFDADGWLSRQVDASTDVIVYFAGLTIIDGKTGTSYLLPNDGDPNFPAQSGLALVELYARLGALRARSVTVFLETGSASSVRDEGSAKAGTAGIIVSLESPALRSPTLAVFSAASGTQFANGSPTQRHGLFTYWLLAGLRGAADADGDGAITVGELDRYLVTHVARDAARADRTQHPATVARDKQRIIVRYK
jgi:hypothetical protein